MKVIYSNSGLANYYGDCIEINKGLREDKILRDYIIKHELGHSDKFDLKYEFSDGIKLMKNTKMFWKILSFCLTHPSTWIDLSPIQYKEKKIVYDVNLTILYSMIICLIILLFIIF